MKFDNVENFGMTTAPLLLFLAVDTTVAWL